MVWEILSSNYEFVCKWLKVRKDHVRLPSGVEIADYYVLEYPDWINVIAITEENKFVLERQYRHGTRTVDYELCAGTIEPGESAMEAAQRELLEETGYAGGNWSLYCVSTPNPAAMTNTNYSFLAVGVKYTGQRYLESTEDIEIQIFNYEEMKKIVKSGGVKQGQMLAPLWKYIAEH